MDIDLAFVRAKRRSSSGNSSYDNWSMVSLKELASDCWNDCLFFSEEKCREIEVTDNEPGDVILLFDG